MLLGRPGADLSEQRRLAELEVQALNVLKTYSDGKTSSMANGKAKRHTFDDRFTKIFVRLFSLRSLDSATIEQLFFANLIGQVQIDNVIPYILKLGGAGVSANLTSY